MNDSDDRPLSVLMPVRDGADTVSEAVQDISMGLAAGDELLVIDDGSTDGTADILRSLRERIPQLRVETTTGIGLVDALNLGLREATHRWIARADADDRYPASRLPQQRSARAAGVVAITGDYRVMTGSGSVTEIPCALTPPFVALSLVNPQRFPHPGVMYDREAVLAAGGYRAGDFPAEDLGLWLRLSREGDLVGVPGVVVDWRMHSGSITHSRQSEQRAMTERLLAEWRTTARLSIDEAAVRGELDAYWSASLAERRRVLLLRDLWTGRRLGVEPRAFVSALREFGRAPVASIKAVQDLRAESRTRGRARAATN